MRGLLEFFPILVIVLVILSVARNLVRMAKKMGEPPATPGSFDAEVAERTRRIQEEIRRKIAERRGTVPIETRPVGPGMEPPEIIAEPPVEPAYAATTAAVLERQQQLANQMRALELARVAEQRRAVHAAATLKTAAESETGMLAASRNDLLADLREPASLRRAFVLREVLGAPVGLR
jgi:hypothetical protein